MNITIPEYHLFSHSQLAANKGHRVDSKPNLRVAHLPESPVLQAITEALSQPIGTLRTDLTWLLLTHTRNRRIGKIHRTATRLPHSTPRRVHSFVAILDRLVQPLWLGWKRRAPPKSRHQHGRPASSHLLREVMAASPG